MPCAIARKMLHWFRTHIDRHSNNDDVFMHFENLWENTYYSSQFKNGEVCSRIDGSHVKKFIERVNGLVDVINNAYASNTCIKNFTQLLKLLLYFMHSGQKLLLKAMIPIWKRLKPT